MAVAVVGLGLGVQAASLFRLATRVGLGTPGDDILFSIVGVLLLALGALLFGSLVRTKSAAGWSSGAFFAAGLSTLSLAVIAATTSPLGFKAHCARFDADASLAGTPLVDLSAALVMFVLPAFGIGALLRSRRGLADFVATAVGFALGWAARPHLFRAMESLDWKSSGSAGLVLWGAAIVGVGILLRALMGAPQVTGGRGLGVVAGLGLLVAAVLLPISPIEIYHPWQRFAVKPLGIIETPVGQFTVQPAQSAHLQVLLDQRPISPDGPGLALEAACLRRTLDAYPKDDTPWPPRTLVIGLITPERAALLSSAGLTDIERTAVWFEDMEAVESLVWAGGQPSGQPPGQAVNPDTLGDAAPYDLVLTFPTGAYRAAGWDLRLVEAANATVKTAWLPWDAGVQAKVNGTELALASNGIEGFAFGLVGGQALGFETYGAQVQEISPEWMETRPEARPLFTLRSLPIHEPALLLHAGAQRISSPFEGRAERVELEPKALELWRDRALNGDAAPGAYLQGVLEGAAVVLMAQRQVPWIFEYLAPIAERFPSWLSVQAAVAQAEAEELDFAAAAARLRPLVTAHPNRSDLAIQLSDALTGLGDPEGRAIAQGMLRDDPENPMLFGLARGVRGMTTMGQPGGYESLTAEEAGQIATGAVLGTIEGVSVQEVDPGDGAPLYLTTLRVSGTRLASVGAVGAVGDTPTGLEPVALHEVTFLGGFIDPEHGSFNSTAPPSHQTREGRRILYYYQAQDDIAGGVPGNALLRGRAGLFTAFETRQQLVMVQGRGNAAPIPYNVVSDEL